MNTKIIKKCKGRTVGTEVWLSPKFVGFDSPCVHTNQNVCLTYGREEKYDELYKGCVVQYQIRYVWLKTERFI